LDQTDPIISGNKWFKLKYNIAEAKKNHYTSLLSFGGPYSNHLHALAAAGKANGFNTIGIIRGEQHLPLNPTLSDITKEGMKLYYINRETYRNKQSIEVIEQIKAMIYKDDPFNEYQQADQFYLVPEGGTNTLALQGASEIASYIPDNSHYVCIPCGTGGTMAGLITGLTNNHKSNNASLPSLPQILGFAAMKGGGFLEKTIAQLLAQYTCSEQANSIRTSNRIEQRPIWEILCDWHFGGFGKIDKALALFIEAFEQKYSIELDPIYTAKMMYAIVALAEDNYFPVGSNIIAVHTGGLQGKRGMEQRYQALLSN
jgi:1-aminocyclopropane-1-carboxylate deaminase/D-cysteine desulfhydrase-like pyridoxal-dependent ACC family enzyme